MTPGNLNLPPKTDRRWRDLVLGVNPVAPKMLALKFLLTRVTLDAKKDPSPACIQKGIEELYTFFQANQRATKDDAAVLFR